MTTADLADLFTELGIPADYGNAPPLPSYAEATELTEIGANIMGRMQQLTPASADAYIMGRMQQLTPASADAWRAMSQAAAADKVTLLAVSGFRSIDYQAMLIRRKLNNGERIDDILKINVAPGFSQHHTGNAMDIATPGYKPLLEEFDESPAFQWLQAHAAEFGFRMSYPRGNPQGVIYEPWHWYRGDT